MRYIILPLMICFSAVAAENTNSPTSLQEFSKQARESYEKKDGDWILKHTDTNGVPAEIAAAQGAFLKSFWGSGNLVLTSVETFRFDDYKPKSAPEEFHGRKLRFVGKPTHWIVLKTAPPKPKSGEESAPKMGVKVAFAVLQENGQWMIAGSTYAD